MILTYKIRHGRDFSSELSKARKIAEFAVRTKANTTASVRHIGLKSVIANQILRKYGRNKTIKQVRRVKLTLPAQGIRINNKSRIISIPCLGLDLRYDFPDYKSVSQVEIGEEYVHVSVEVDEPLQYNSGKYLGVDLNTTGHVAVAADPETGKMWKLGKQAYHIHNKYRDMRRRLQKLGKLRKVKQLRNRESRIVRNLNYRISRKIVEIAKASNRVIKLEDLTHIRKRAKTSKSFRYSLNSWSFYQLRQMIEYKAKLLGVVVCHVDPAYTSKTCSKCGALGDRDGKSFKCPSCGHVENADVNAAFNIALRQWHISILSQTEMRRKGALIPLEAQRRRKRATPEPFRF